MFGYHGAMRASAILAVVLASFILVPLASAQPMTGERWIRGRPHRITGDFTWSYSEGRLEPAISPGFWMRFRLVDDGHRYSATAFVLDLDIQHRAIGIAGALDSFRVGNPFIGLRMGARNPEWVARGGIGSAPPLTNAFADGLPDQAAYAAGTALWGGWAPWLFWDQAVPLVFYGDFEYHHRWFQVGGDVAFAAMFGVPESGASGNTEFVFQTGFFFAFTPIEEVAFGVRGQFVFASDWPAAGGDELQYAMALPFFRVQLEPVYFELRLNLNFDRPFGLAFDDGVWAMAFLVGGQF